MLFMIDLHQLLCTYYVPGTVGTLSILIETSQQSPEVGIIIIPIL